MKRGFIITMAAICWGGSVSAQVTESADLTLTIERDPPPTQVALSGFTDLNLTYNADTGEFDTDDLTWPMCMYSYEDEFTLTLESTASNTAGIFTLRESVSQIAFANMGMVLHRRSPTGETMEGLASFRDGLVNVVDLADAKQDETCSSHSNVHFLLDFPTIQSNVDFALRDPVRNRISDPENFQYSATFTLTMEPLL